jgi:hypothetical protein
VGFSSGHVKPADFCSRRIIFRAANAAKMAAYDPLRKSFYQPSAHHFQLLLACSSCAFNGRF